MSATTEEISIDIDELDAKAAQEAAKSAKSAKSDPKVAETALATETGPVTVEKSEPEAKTAAKPGVTPDEGLEKLRQQLEDERTARQVAEARANEAAQAEVKARTEVQTSQLDVIKGAIERLTASSDVLEDQYANAMAAQDWKAAAKTQRQMADNASKLAQLEAGKVALEKAPKPVPRASADPVEHFAAQLSPASATWVRAHPEFVRDQHKNQQMIAAHQLAIARGYKADTPEYFTSIEKTLDLTPAVIKPPEQETDPMADAAQPTRRAPAAAPVSRSNGANGGRPNVVRLTPAEVEIAQAMNMSVEEYARQKVALRKEGKLS